MSQHDRTFGGKKLALRPAPPLPSLEPTLERAELAKATRHYRRLADNVKLLGEILGKIATKTRKDVRRDSKGFIQEVTETTQIAEPIPDREATDLTRILNELLTDLRSEITGVRFAQVDDFEHPAHAREYGKMLMEVADAAEAMQAVATLVGWANPDFRMKLHIGDVIREKAFAPGTVLDAAEAAELRDEVVRRLAADEAEVAGA